MDSVGNNQQDAEEDSVVQLAIDLKNTYSEMNIQLQPTQIALTMLLKLAGVLHRHLTGSIECDKSRQTDEREERRLRRRACRAKYRLMARQSCKMVEGAQEYFHANRVANIKPSKDCGAQSKPPLKKSVRDTVEPDAQTSSADSLGGDSEVFQITQQIAKDSPNDWPQREHWTNSEASATLSHQHLTKSKATKLKRSVTWHGSFPRDQVGVRHSITGIERGRTRRISDSEAQLINEPYRLMTSTHSRLSSVSPPVSRSSSSHSFASGSISKTKVQPVLGLRQRHRKNNLLRRKTVHIVPSHDQPVLVRHHRRSRSDSALQNLPYQTRDRSCLKMSSYHETIDAHQMSIDNNLADLEDFSSEPIYAVPRRGPKDKRDFAAPEPNLAPALNFFSQWYSYDEVRCQEEGDHYYREKRHESGVWRGSTEKKTEVHGRYGTTDYSVVLTPAEQAIEEIWRHENELLQGKLEDKNNNSYQPASASYRVTSPPRVPHRVTSPPRVPHRVTNNPSSSYRESSTHRPSCKTVSSHQPSGAAVEPRGAARSSRSSKLRSEKREQPRLQGKATHSIQTKNKDSPVVPVWRPPTNHDSEADSLISVKAVLVQTTHVSPNKSHLVRPVRRTVTMPAQAQQPIIERRQLKPDVKSQIRNPTLNAGSQRPGRGVFTSSGHCVHEGQRAGANRPPRLPVRNSSPVKNGRTMSTDRAMLSQNKPHTSEDYSVRQQLGVRASHHTDRPDISDRSTSHQKPMDQLRNRVMLEQEKQQQHRLHQNEVIRPSSKSNTPEQTFQYHGSSVPTTFEASQSQFSQEQSRRSRSRSRKDADHGYVSSEISRKPLEYKTKSSLSQQETVPFKTRVKSPERSRPESMTRLQNSLPQPLRSHSPEKIRTNLESEKQQVTQQIVPQVRPYITRTTSPSRMYHMTQKDQDSQSAPLRQDTTTSHTQYPITNNSQEHDSLKKQAAVGRDSVHQRKVTSGKEYSEHPKSAASNKYKMLVCPDFFPVAKLNGLPKRKTPADNFLVNEVFVEPPKEYCETSQMGEFYSKKVNGVIPSRPMLQRDDSFVEDPREQLLYPSKKSTRRPKSQLADSADFYYEVSPDHRTASNDGATNNMQDSGVFTMLQSNSTNIAGEGDSLYSIHGSLQVPESPASLQSSQTSDGSRSSTSTSPATRFNPPPYRQALEVSQLNKNLKTKANSSQHQSHFTHRPLQSVNRPLQTSNQTNKQIHDHPINQESRHRSVHPANQWDKHNFGRLPNDQAAHGPGHLSNRHKPISDQNLEYHRKQTGDDKVNTARPPPNAEPVASYEEKSHYSTVSVYRNQPIHTKTLQETSQMSEKPARDDSKIQPERELISHGGFHDRIQGLAKPPIVIGGKTQYIVTSQAGLESVSNVRTMTTSVQLAGVSPAVQLHQTRIHDDELLEKIKAQNTVSVAPSRVKGDVSRSTHPGENIYENLPHQTKVRSHSPSNQHQSVANPDYFHPPTIYSQMKPTKSSRGQAGMREHGLRHSAPGKQLNSQISSGFSADDRMSEHSQPVFNATLISEQMVEPLSQSSSIENLNRASTLSSSLGREYDSETGSTKEEPLKVPNSVKLLEPPKEYVPFLESESSWGSDDGSSLHSQSFRVTAARTKRKSQRTHKLGFNNQMKPAAGAHVTEGQELEKEGAESRSVAKDVSYKGLGDDILSITKMWKNLPSNDTWDDKRRALLGDPIMSSITEKMEAILHSPTEPERSTQTRSLSHESAGIEQPSLQSPQDLGLVTREPGEGSSDDLDDSMDLRLKKLHHQQMNESQAEDNKDKRLVGQSCSSISTNLSKIPKLNSKHRSGMPIRHKKYLTHAPPAAVSLSTHDASNPSEDTKEEGVEVIDAPFTERDVSEDLFQAKRLSIAEPTGQSKPSSAGDMSDSEEISDDSLEGANNSNKHADPDDSDDSDHQLAEETGIQYLSDYHRMKTRSRQRAPNKKKISFSSDARKQRPGDLLTSGQEGTLLSVNPFMTSSPSPEQSPSQELLSVNPFLSYQEGPVTTPESDAEGKKPRLGILKRSDENAGSQLSLGTCSEFGSHISLASGDSGMSRAGSFPLLTMSDGSKKDFKITFNETDTEDMGNLFRVVRKARSEGAASEPESTDSDSDDDATPIACKNCQLKQPLFKARLIYKMCHGCYTYYCSSDCRREDWTAHKPLCIVSRLSSLARKIFKCIMTDQELLHHCSRFARTGYLCEGRGAVVLSFSSPRKAQLFLSNAKQAKESALYLCVKDLQKFSFDDKKDKDQLISNCKHYNPDEKFVLHLAIKMTRSLSGQAVEPRIKGREFHKWARLRLSERHNVVQGERYGEEDTLILTALSSAPEQNGTDHIDLKSREVFFATVVTKLRKRGISLRHQYPDVYNALCHYVKTGKVFAPISLFAFNLHTQKRFMCCIMPYSDPDVTWGNNPHLLEDLDLVVTL